MCDKSTNNYFCKYFDAKGNFVNKPSFWALHGEKLMPYLIVIAVVVLAFTLGDDINMIK